jgi:hypothetical protein
LRRLPSGRACAVDGPANGAADIVRVVEWAPPGVLCQGLHGLDVGARHRQRREDRWSPAWRSRKRADKPARVDRIDRDVGVADGARRAADLAGHRLTSQPRIINDQREPGGHPHEVLPALHAGEMVGDRFEGARGRLDPAHGGVGRDDGGGFLQPGLGRVVERGVSAGGDLRRLRFGSRQLGRCVAAVPSQRAEERRRLAGEVVENADRVGFQYVERDTIVRPDRGQELHDVVARLDLVVPARVESIEQDHRDAAADPAFEPVGERRRAWIGTRRGHPVGHDREDGNWLISAILGQPEVSGGQPGHRPPSSVPHDHAHLDESGRRAKHGALAGGWSSRRLTGRRAGRKNAGQSDGSRDPSHSSGERGHEL